MSSSGLWWVHMGAFTPPPPSSLWVPVELESNWTDVKKKLMQFNSFQPHMDIQKVLGACFRTFLANLPFRSPTVYSVNKNIYYVSRTFMYLALCWSYKIFLCMPQVGRPFIRAPPHKSYSHTEGRARAYGSVAGCLAIMKSSSVLSTKTNKNQSRLKVAVSIRNVRGS